MGQSVIDALANGPVDVPEFLFTLVERGSSGPPVSNG
jgi:LacI family transcriptional regulator